MEDIKKQETITKEEITPKTYSQEDVDKLVKTFEENTNKKIIEVYEKFLSAKPIQNQAEPAKPVKKNWKF